MGIDRIYLDASHIYFLVRAVVSDPDPKGQFLEMLEAHACDGSRSVLSTRTCVEEECFRRISGKGKSLTDVNPNIAYEDIVATVRVLDDLAITAAVLPLSADGLPVSLDSGERSLVDVAVDEDEALIVLNDESAFDVLNALMLDGVNAAVPVTSLAFFHYMYRCGALTSFELEVLCEQVYRDVERLVDMSDKKKSRKLTYAADVAAQVALEEARREHHAVGGA